MQVVLLGSYLSLDGWKVGFIRRKCRSGRSIASQIVCWLGIVYLFKIELSVLRVVWEYKDFSHIFLVILVRRNCSLVLGAAFLA